jgi:DNA-binding NarL/FixJ family response regulator
VLIIVDLSMPRMQRLEVSRALRRIMPSVPVVLFTMHKDAVRESDAVDAGISAVVSKTDGMHALVKQVQNLLEPVV